MDKNKLRFIYGIILVAVGLGVFYRVPQVMPQLETIEFFAQKTLIVKIALYVLGLFLILAGGIRINKSRKSQKLDQGS
jgi:hypothetical protein